MVIDCNYYIIITISDFKLVLLLSSCYLIIYLFYMHSWHRFDKASAEKFATKVSQSYQPDKRQVVLSIDEVYAVPTVNKGSNGKTVGLVKDINLQDVIFMRK